MKCSSICSVRRSLQISMAPSKLLYEALEKLVATSDRDQNTFDAGNGSKRFSKLVNRRAEAGEIILNMGRNKKKNKIQKIIENEVCTSVETQMV